jgi:hypothetical protein
MSDQGDVAVDEELVRSRAIPDLLGEGATILLASSGDPVREEIGLKLLRNFGDSEDVALVVETTEGSDQAVETYQGLESATDGPALRLVDTVSEQQSIAAVYDETPVIFTPAQGDLERLVMALSELTAPDPPTDGARHLLVRSLTPILEESSNSRVQSVLERITGLRSEDGLCILALDYTSHDEATLQGLSGLVDGILWVTQSASGEVDFEYRPARAHTPPLPPDVGGDD